MMVPKMVMVLVRGPFPPALRVQHCLACISSVLISGGRPGTRAVRISATMQAARQILDSACHAHFVASPLPSPFPNGNQASRATRQR